MDEADFLLRATEKDHYGSNITRRTSHNSNSHSEQNRISTQFFLQKSGPQMLCGVKDVYAFIYRLL